MYFIQQNNSKIRITTSTKIGTGGEGNVFSIEDDDQLCVKIYHQDILFENWHKNL